MKFFAFNTRFNVAVDTLQDALKILHVENTNVVVTNITENLNLVIAVNGALQNFLTGLSLKTATCKELPENELKALLDGLVPNSLNFGNTSLLNSRMVDNSHL